MTYELYWERIGEHEARLLRVFGTMPKVVLPEQIEGKTIVEIGAYCFAERARLPEQFERTRIVSEDILEENISSVKECVCTQTVQQETGSDTEIFYDMRELSGRYIKEVILPDSVRKIGNLAFYHCMSLERLTVGYALTEIGSDVFMNCSRLHHITLHGSCKNQSGIRQILAQLSSDMEVTFVGDKGTDAKLLFPEYYESYDEIAPAHLFGRNIEGEGFRARQCFKDGVIDFKQYDTIFPKACAEESERTLCRLAYNRLRYPVDLGEKECEAYEEYISKHVKHVCATAVVAREMEQIAFLCERRLFTDMDMQMCIRMATESDWPEGSAYFLRLKEQHFAKKAEDRYAFDDF